MGCPAGLPGGRLAVGGGGRRAQVVPWQATRSPDPPRAGSGASAAAVVRRPHPELVHLHSGKASLAGRLALWSRLPTVFQPHAWTFLAAEGSVGAASLRWERWAGRWTDLVMAVSEDEERRGREAGVRAPAVVTPNGVSTCSAGRWPHPAPACGGSTTASVSIASVICCSGPPSPSSSARPSWVRTLGSPAGCSSTSPRQGRGAGDRRR